jgi:hypothetical protein
LCGIWWSPLAFFGGSTASSTLMRTISIRDRKAPALDRRSGSPDRLPKQGSLAKVSGNHNFVRDLVVAPRLFRRFHRFIHAYAYNIYTRPRGSRAGSPLWPT